MLDPYRLEIPIGVSYVDINTSAPTTTLVNGVPGKRIYVLSFSVVCNLTTAVTLQTSTGTIAIAGPYYCITNGGVVLPHNAGGWCATAFGDSLLLAMSPSGPIGGSLSYTLA